MSSSRPELVVDWCSYEAAKYAVMHWHYSELMPSKRTKPVKLGVWEGSTFIGTVIFTMGVSASLAKPYGLGRFEVCELQRVALCRHVAPTSQVVARAVVMLKKQSPGIRLIVSFADPFEGHEGIIYQAGNWVYTGTTSESYVYIDQRGNECHPRTVQRGGGKDKFGNTARVKENMARRESRPPKHRYLYPLDRAIRRQIAPLAKPYPKRGPGVQGDAPTVQVGGPGSSPGVRSKRLANMGLEPRLVE